MGADLYWKVTPKEHDEELYGFDDDFFCKLWDIPWGERSKLDGKVIDTNYLEELKSMYNVLLSGNGNKDTIQYLDEMIKGIEKNVSITIVYRS